MSPLARGAINMIRTMYFTSVGAIGLAVVVGGCATQEKTNEPINCATAESDIRTLQSEKEKNTDSFGVADQRKMIDDKIAQIRRACPSS